MQSFKFADDSEFLVGGLLGEAHRASVVAESVHGTIVFDGDTVSESAHGEQNTNKTKNSHF